MRSVNNIGTWMNRKLLIVPVLGIAGFLFLYFYAAYLYPGGTKLDPSSSGYSQIHNYWCDLLDETSYSGRENPGRPFALLGTFILPLSMILFWYFIPNLFVGNSWKDELVRQTGIAAMVLGVFIYTPAHDLIINIAGILFLTAFGVTQFALWQSRHLRLFSLASVAFALALANSIMWRFGILLEFMPIVQKLAFLSFFIWMVFSSLLLMQIKSAKA